MSEPAEAERPDYEDVAPGEITREQMAAIARILGHEPNEVMSIDVEWDRATVRTIDRDGPDGPRFYRQTLFRRRGE